MIPRESFAACSKQIASVTQLAAVNWGTWQIPGGSGTTAIVTTGSLTTGSTGTKIYGTVSAGNFTVTGQNGGGSCSTVTISITAAGTCGTGCTLSAPMASWNGGTATALPLTSATLPSTGGTNLKIGATATYGSTVPAASNSIPYDITIQYDSNANQTYPETATIGFDKALSFSAVTGINFGYAKAATVGTYVMSTTGTVTASGGGVLEPGGTTAVGSVTIGGSTSQGITISVGNYVANSGVTPSLATGKYGAGANDAAFPMNVAAPGAGTVLKLGVQVVASGTQTNGTTATPTFDVTVVYQ